MIRDINIFQFTFIKQIDKSKIIIYDIGIQMSDKIHMSGGVF